MAMKDKPPQADLDQLRYCLEAMGFTMAEHEPPDGGYRGQYFIQARSDSVIVNWWPLASRAPTYVDHRRPENKHKNKVVSWCHDGTTFLSRCKTAAKAAERT